MGALTSTELTSVRNECARTITVNYTKPQLNAVSQALEDWLVSKSAEVSALMDSVQAGLTNAQKKKIFAEVVRLKYDRDK